MRGTDAVAAHLAGRTGVAAVAAVGGGRGDVDALAEAAIVVGSALVTAGAAVGRIKVELGADAVAAGGALAAPVAAGATIVAVVLEVGEALALAAVKTDATGAVVAVAGSVGWSLRRHAGSVAASLAGGTGRAIDSVAAPAVDIVVGHVGAVVKAALPAVWADVAACCAVKASSEADAGAGAANRSGATLVSTRAAVYGVSVRVYALARTTHLRCIAGSSAGAAVLGVRGIVGARPVAAARVWGRAGGATSAAVCGIQ